MQLRNARLCLDCEEVHDAQHCPACASESFAFITRWVPSPSSSAEPPQPAPDQVRPERPQPRPRSEDVEPAARETLDTYRQLLDRAPRPSPWRFVPHGAVGLALFGLAGWVLKQNNQRPSPGPHDDTPGGTED